MLDGVAASREASGQVGKRLDRAVGCIVGFAGDTVGEKGGPRTMTEGEKKAYRQGAEDARKAAEAMALKSRRLESAATTAWEESARGTRDSGTRINITIHAERAEMAAYIAAKIRAMPLPEPPPSADDDPTAGGSTP